MKYIRVVISTQIISKSHDNEKSRMINYVHQNMFWHFQIYFQKIDLIKIQQNHGIRRQKKSTRFGHFGGFLLDFPIFIYWQLNQHPIEISWSSGLSHQVSNQDILQFCGSIPSLFHKINFSLIIFLSFNFEKYFFIVS